MEEYARNLRILRDCAVLEEVDTFDRKILAALQEDGRLTNGELAERVGLSASQCSRRRTRLEHTGIISGYHARLDAQKVGIGLTSLVLDHLVAS